MYAQAERKSLWAILSSQWLNLESKFLSLQIMAPAEIKSVQDEMTALQNAPGVPKSTAAILKAGLLTSRELYYDAREILAEAVKADPDEPTLHFLLAEVYEKTGLKDMAAEEYSESDFLLKQRQ